jgi:hypothetical protein
MSYATQIMRQQASHPTGITIAAPSPLASLGAHNDMLPHMLRQQNFTSQPSQPGGSCCGQPVATSASAGTAASAGMAARIVPASDAAEGTRQRQVRITLPRSP